MFVDAWVRSRQLALPLAAFVSLVLLRLHPRPVNATPTFDFTTSFMGVMTGVCYSVSHNEGFYTPAVQLKSVWAHSPYWIARRLLAGRSSAVALLLPSGPNRSAVVTPATSSAHVD